MIQLGEKEWLQNMFEKELTQLQETNSYRTIPEITEKDGKYVIVNDNKLLKLSSNDYLNLSKNEKLSKEFLREFENCNQIQFSSVYSRGST